MPKDKHLTLTYKPKFMGVIQSECEHKNTLWKWLPPSECVWGYTRGLVCLVCNDILARS